jgi:hypothetical protein
MKGVTKSIETYMDANADKIITKGVGHTFDSYDFIDALRKHKPEENPYAEWFKRYSNVNSQIARYLSAKEVDLNIEKSGQVTSRNIKGGKSINQKWKKL